MLWGKKWKSQQLPGVEPRTPGLFSQCSATELRQPDNHQPSQSSICTAQVGLKASVAHLAEHWQLKPEVSGFDSHRLPAFSLSSIFTSQHLNSFIILSYILSAPRHLYRWTSVKSTWGLCAWGSCAWGSCACPRHMNSWCISKACVTKSSAIWLFKHS